MSSRFFGLLITAEAPENKVFFDFCWTNRRHARTRRAPIGLVSSCALARPARRRWGRDEVFRQSGHALPSIILGFWPLALAVTVPRIGEHDHRVEVLRLSTVRRSHDDGGGKEPADHKIELTAVELAGRRDVLVLDAGHLNSPACQAGPVSRYH